MRRCFTSCARQLSHENPLGLPRSAPTSRGPPPQLPRAQRGLPQKRPIPHVRKIVAISSAKGGVGKSTLAVNLALAFSRHNFRTGILDTDIFGPSIPTLLGLEDAGPPEVTAEGRLRSVRGWGIGSMSMGYLLGQGRRRHGKDGEPNDADAAADNDGPVAWRGLMVMKALQQLLHEVQWAGPHEPQPELDILVLDLPPGTGDVQLTIGQQVIVDGAVVVSTPQDVALRDAVRGVKMFDAMGIRVLGLVRNMSVFVCPHCGHETRVFAHDHDHDHTHNGQMGSLNEKMRAMRVPLLGEIPLDPQICYDADRGAPTVVSEEARGQRKNSRFFEAIAERVAADVGLPWR